ncbi:helix-turn-helix transcriptional regulator [Microbacterium sp. gxy059]|uniref:helix-turn-helix transcriptional regulator n=1 Tax=Microbacterium sp. gxy059 TaxID=2957199 RepID=UPI003D9607C1
MSDRIPAEERLMNLTVALLGTEVGLTRQQIFDSVSGFFERADAGTGREALERMFERDKETLVSLGMRIEVIGDPANPQDLRGARYRIPREDNALPDDIDFAPDELALLSLAAEAWGEAAMSGEARAALRKIRALGIDVDEPILGFAPRLAVRETAFGPLQQAIDAARVVRFSYLNPGRSEALARVVRPLALVQFEGRWHLRAWDEERRAARTFLLRRITSDVADAGRGFDPAERSGAADRAIADLAALARRQSALIEASPGSEAELRLRRRATRESDGALAVPYVDEEVLADEIASYGPEARVVAPGGLRDRVIARLRGVRAAHSGAADAADLQIEPARRRRRTPLASSDRVRIYLTLVPWLLERGDAPLAEAAAAFDVAEREMRVMIERLALVGEPARGMYTGDMFDIDWDLLDERGIIRLTHAVGIERVQRLTTREAAALIAGLQLVQALPGVDAARIAALRDKLGRGSSAMPAEPVVVPTEIDELRTDLTRAVAERRVVRFSYRPLRGDRADRAVDPSGLLLADGEWYLQGWCHLRRSVRTFHLERMSEVAVTEEPAARTERIRASMFQPADDDEIAILRFPTAMRPVVADFLEHAEEDARGERTIARLPVGDARVLKRLAGRGGGAIEVLAPAAAREAARNWAADGETLQIAALD